MAESYRCGTRGRGLAIALNGSLAVSICGSSSSVPRLRRACSSYLIGDADQRIAFDFGTGSFANLRTLTDYDQLDAVIISHMHADHFLDLVPLRYALRYGAKRRMNRLPLWVPPGGESMLRVLASAFASEGDDDFWDEVLDLREFDPDRSLVIGRGEIHFAPTTHYIPSFALRYQRDDASITYSADTAPDPAVVRVAQGTNIFLCEATLVPGSIEIGVRGHSSAVEAAQMAHDAGVQRLILTHYGGDVSTDELQASAARVFRGEISIADDLLTFSTRETATLG